jgi:hypothetical protein
MRARDFWHLRSQNLLSFTRKDIAKFTAVETHIFSKIQKHRKSLEEARAYIRKAFESTPADCEVIRTDNNTKRGFYFINKYIQETREF